MRFEECQFLSPPERGTSELQGRHEASVQEAETLQSWFSYKNNFSEQKLKLREEKSKMSETKKPHMSALPFPRDADLGGGQYMVEPQLHQRAQAFQGETVGCGHQVTAGKLQSEALLVVICIGALSERLPWASQHKQPV